MNKSERFVYLSWEILKLKCHYYMFSESLVSDYQYDLLEKEYDSLADELELPKSATDMVDFDVKRPACYEVYIKALRKRKKKK